MKNVMLNNIFRIHISVKIHSYYKLTEIFYKSAARVSLIEVRVWGSSTKIFHKMSRRTEGDRGLPKFKCFTNVALQWKSGGSSQILNVSHNVSVSMLGGVIQHTRKILDQPGPRI